MITAEIIPLVGKVALISGMLDLCLKSTLKVFLWNRCPVFNIDQAVSWCEIFLYEE